MKYYTIIGTKDSAEFKIIELTQEVLGKLLPGSCKSIQEATDKVKQICAGLPPSKYLDLKSFGLDPATTQQYATYTKEAFDTTQ